MDWDFGILVYVSRTSVFNFKTKLFWEVLKKVI